MVPRRRRITRNPGPGATDEAAAAIAKWPGIGFAACFLVFVTFFAGRPIVAGLEMFNLHINVDALLSTLMVIVRYVLALIVLLIPDPEMQTMARDPYPDR